MTGRNRHTVELSDEAWNRLADIAISEGIIYHGRPSRNLVIEALVDGLFSGESKDTPPLPPLAPVTNVVSFEDAVAKMPKYHRNAIYDGSPHQAKILRHFYELVVGDVSQG